MKEYVKCKIPIRFPLKPNSNNFCFTKESLTQLKSSLNNMPIIKDEFVVGILSNSFDTYEKEDEFVVFADAILWLDCNPSITVYGTKEVDGVKVINSFVLNSVSI